VKTATSRNGDSRLVKMVNVIIWWKCILSVQPSWCPGWCFRPSFRCDCRRL